MGHNLDDNGSCGFFNTGDLSIVAADLAPLGDYGGPTMTHALGTGPGMPHPACVAASLAIDAGDNAACPPTDQRGAPRPYGSACDMGAYESGAQPPTPTPCINNCATPSPTPTITPTLTATTTNSRTATPNRTPTLSATNSRTPSKTATQRPTVTATVTFTRTPTPPPRPTATKTPAPTLTPPACVGDCNGNRARA
jgi:hypothetical protein